MKWEKDAKTSTDAIGTSFDGMLKKIVAGFSAAKIGQMLLNIGKDAVQAASDLAEVQNVVDVTFGDAGAAKIEAWAKKAGEQFGLTETQAKRFTSTLGAMMKSAGMSGDEITEMSTDLAGLAADMASFYNLDFDTAFQKIRSGISGETEPLKQLGINMSEANLNAFALQKGLEKTFSQMTQGEKTILRYQYLMQATSDAQGDFARTSDGFANATRMLETNIESLKAKLGTVLLPVVNDVVGALNDMLGAMTGEHDTTILDEFAAIDLKTQEKIAAIEDTASTARTLTGVLKDIEDQAEATKKTAGKILDEVPDGKSGNLKSLADKLEGIEAQADTNRKAVGEMGDDAPNERKVEDFKTTLTGIEKQAGYNRKAIEGMADDAPSGDDGNIVVLEGNLKKVETQASTNKDRIGEMLDDAPTGDSGNISTLEGNLKRVETQASTNRDRIAEMTEDVPNGAEVSTLEENLKKVETQASTNRQKIGDMADDAPSGETGNVPELERNLKEIENQATSNRTAIEGMADDAPRGDTGNVPELEGNLKKVETQANTSRDAIGGMGDVEPNTENLQGIREQVTNIGTAAEGAQAAIEGITSPTDAAAESNALWLETCEELVRTIPGLSEIIDTQTGEIKGGTQAVYDYIDAWEQAQKGVVLKAAHEQKRGALEAKAAELGDYELAKMVADHRVREQMKQLDALRQELGISGNGYDMVIRTNAVGGQGILTEAEQAWNEQIKTLGELRKAQDEATKSYQVQKDAYDEAVISWEEEGKAIEEGYNKAIEAADAWTLSQQEAAQAALSAFDEALQAVEDYYNKVHEETAAQVNNTLTGFEGIKTAAQQYKEAANAAEEYSKKLKEARAEGKNALTDLEIETTANAKNNQITMQGMLQNLEDQLAYIEEYQQNLAIARESGISDEILGMLSDGSNESALYLNAIAEAAKTGNEEDIQRLNDMWTEVNKGKESFVDTLTQQKLEVDKTYDEMVKKAEEAAAALDVSQQAGESTGKNVQAMIDAIRDHVPGIAEQVDAVLAQLNRLNEWGVTIDYGFGASTVIKPGARGSGGPQVASLAVGMDWIPFDGFLATLHQGEAVLTAEENRVWQAFKNGQRGVDYDTLGGVMRENVKAGGNVYLDGRVVGSVISQMQGNQYRTMQRSGWQQ